MRVACQRCGAESQRERVGVRETCDGCGAYLHSCRGCASYAPGAHNDCREPQAEVVGDKETANFCDYFRPSSLSPRRSDRSGEARERLQRLFRKG